MNEELMQDLNERLAKYPYNMHAENIADFLGICQSTAYKMASTNDFPKLNIPGSRLIVIPKPLFIQWYVNNCVYIETNE